MRQLRILSACLAFMICQSAFPDSLQSVKPLSKSKALTWSIGATFAPVALGGGLLYASYGTGSDNFVIWGLCVGSAGFVLGPGAGHLYARQPARFWSGTAVRAIGGGIAVFGLALLNPFSESDASGVLIVGGGLIVLISAVYDIATVGSSVDQYYRQHTLSSIQLHPRYFPKYRAVGLLLSMKL